MPRLARSTRCSCRAHSRLADVVHECGSRTPDVAIERSDERRRIARVERLENGAVLAALLIESRFLW
jgi:hypothetical protein